MCVLFCRWFNGAVGVVAAVSRCPAVLCTSVLLYSCFPTFLLSCFPAFLLSCFLAVLLFFSCFPSCFPVTLFTASCPSSFGPLSLPVAFGLCPCCLSGSVQVRPFALSCYGIWRKSGVNPSAGGAVPLRAAVETADVGGHRCRFFECLRVVVSACSGWCVPVLSQKLTVREISNFTIQLKIPPPAYP